MQIVACISLARGDRRLSTGCVREDEGGDGPFDFYTYLTFSWHTLRNDVTHITSQRYDNHSHLAVCRLEWRYKTRSGHECVSVCVDVMALATSVCLKLKMCSTVIGNVCVQTYPRPSANMLQTRWLALPLLLSVPPVCWSWYVSDSDQRV